MLFQVASRVLVVGLILVQSSTTLRAQRSTSILRPGDRLHIRVWRQPELTSIVTIGTDGRVLIAGLGKFSAAGQTCDQLSETLEQAYVATLGLVGPRVMVVIATRKHNQVPRRVENLRLLHAYRTS